MRRLATYFVLALAGIASTAGAASATAGTPPRDRLRGFLCQRAVAVDDRSISVEAVMRPVPHTKAMEIRFDLFGKPRPDGGYSPVRGGDLGAWLTPEGQPTLGQRPGDVWMISHPVTGLPAPATYRFRVVFRWTGDHGRVLAVRTLMSDKCFQPELRPDLLVASITVDPDPGRPKLNRYTALISNAGATAAGPFVVAFTPAAATGAARNSRFVPGLAAHASTAVTFVGPACTAGTAPAITADPAHNVDDFNTANNTLVATCPAVTPGS